MKLDRVTLRQVKAHYERWLITDPIAHIVMDVDADLEYIICLTWNPLRCTYL